MDDSVEQCPEQDVTEQATEDTLSEDIEGAAEVCGRTGLGLDQEDECGEKGGSDKVEDKARPVGESQDTSSKTEDGRVGRADEGHCLGVLGNEHVDVQGVIGIQLARHD